MRLDVFLAEIGAVSSRTRAANLIDMGRVLVNGKVAHKSAMDVSMDDKIEITEDYEASLGGLKLKEALDKFNIDCRDLVCADIGASNGGFTDVLLKNGAKIVYAIDVGECALPNKLSSDKRVVVMDRTNARYLDKSRFDVLPNLAVIDVSFISLKLILPSVKGILADEGIAIALIKPQFECEKKDLSKRGILVDKKKRDKVVSSIEEFCRQIGFFSLGVIPAPHPFADKNQEYLICLKSLSNVIA